MLPTFIICGVQKSGTTSLYELLEQHPEVALSAPKEVCFFNKDTNYTRGLKWYEEHFRVPYGTKAIGEASPLYYNHLDTPKRIAQTIPQVKVIFVLRNSIDRCYSNYLYNKGKGKKVKSFEKEIETDSCQLIDRGFYYKHLSRWHHYFPAEQIKIILFEDLKNNPTQLMKDIFKFINVSEDFKNHEMIRANPTSIPKNKVSNYILFWAWKLRGIVPTWAKKIWNTHTRPHLTTPTYPAMLIESRKLLINTYREDIQLLEKLINRDLKHWLK